MGSESIAANGAQATGTSTETPRQAARTVGDEHVVSLRLQLGRCGYREFMMRACDQVARGYLADLLRLHDGSVTHAAAQAGMARESLHRLLKRHGLRPADFRAGRRARDGSRHV